MKHIINYQHMKGHYKPRNIILHVNVIFYYVTPFPVTEGDRRPCPVYQLYVINDLLFLLLLSVEK